MCIGSGVALAILGIYQLIEIGFATVAIIFSGFVASSAAITAILTNTRASGSDDAIQLITPKKFSLEEALEFIEDDEYVEITPDEIRIRKAILDPKDRYRENRN